MTTERLRRLAASKPRDGGKVLSVYVDFDPSQFGTQPARASAISSAIDAADREVRDATSLDHGVRTGLRSGLERVRDFLQREFDASGAHGLAVFCDSADELFEALKLPVSVDQRAVITDAPFVEPLAGLDPGARFLIVLANRRVGRLLFGSPDGLREVARVDDETPGHHRRGGLSQPRYERSIDNEALAHIKRVGEAAGRRFGGRALDGILLGGPEDARARLAEALPSALRDQVAGTVAVDVETTSADEVLAAARPEFERLEQAREDEALARLREGLSGGPRPAAGRLMDVLEALNQRRVETLLIAAGTTAPGRECPSCGWLGVGGDECPADGTPTIAHDDVLGPAVQRALLQSADVRFLSPRAQAGEPARAQELDMYGGIGAVLRY